MISKLDKYNFAMVERWVNDKWNNIDFNQDINEKNSVNNDVSSEANKYRNIDDHTDRIEELNIVKEKYYTYREESYRSEKVKKMGDNIVNQKDKESDKKDKENYKNLIKGKVLFDGPPPHVSGDLHMGHVFSYSHHAILITYYKMQNINLIYLVYS